MQTATILLAAACDNVLSRLAGLQMYSPRRGAGMTGWLPGCRFPAGTRRRPSRGEEVQLLLCVADHYEPNENGRVTPEAAMRRVRHWAREYPRQLGGFRDSDGRPPRHTFFFPLEDYVPEHLDVLADLCAAGFGEVEVHLHHENDTAPALREKLLAFKETLAQAATAKEPGSADGSACLWLRARRLGPR